MRSDICFAWTLAFILKDSLAQTQDVQTTPASAPLPKPRDRKAPPSSEGPPLSPKKHFSWQRSVQDEIVRERAFAVDNEQVKAVALISNDPQLPELHLVGAVSLYDFSAAAPMAVLKPYFQGQPCFLWTPPEADFNSTLAFLAEINGATANTTDAVTELMAGDLSMSDSERGQLFAAHPVLRKLCGHQPIFVCFTQDPLAYDTHLMLEAELLTFNALTLNGTVSITFTWEGAAR